MSNVGSKKVRVIEHPRNYFLLFVKAIIQHFASVFKFHFFLVFPAIFLICHVPGLPKISVLGHFQILRPEAFRQKLA